MKLLAVAVAGAGVVDPDEPVFGAGDEALLRGRAAFETTRVYGGRPFCLPEHVERLAASAASLGLDPPDRAETAELAATALEAAARARRRPPPLLDRHDARRHRRRDPARARGAPRARPAARLAAPRRRARASRLAAARRQVDELRGEHGRRGRGPQPWRRRRGLPRQRRHRARGADLQRLVAPGRHALHAVARGRRARGRHPRDAARARAAGRLPRRAGRLPARRASPTPTRRSPRRRSARWCRWSSSTAAPIGTGRPATPRRRSRPRSASARRPLRLVEAPQTGGSLIACLTTRSVSVAWLS